LITVDLGTGINDILNVNDSADTNDNVGMLTNTTLTWLDMPVVAEIQTIFVQAKSGTYKLRTEGFGIEAGLPVTANVARYAGYALVTLDYSLLATQVAGRLTELYGFSDLKVKENRTDKNVTYTLIFIREKAGTDFAQLVWGESREETGLIPNLGASVEVKTSTVQDGTVNPQRDSLQTIAVNATGRSFTITLLGQTTVPILYNADADALLAALNPILNPNNSNPALPHTDNVAVEKYENVFHIIFRGEFADLVIDPVDIDTSLLVGKLAVATRINGINYYGAETMNIDLGSGDDVFNVQGTTAKTNLNLHQGDERIYVSSSEK
jgi:hypothetical protein